MVVGLDGLGRAGDWPLSEWPRPANGIGQGQGVLADWLRCAECCCTVCSLEPPRQCETVIADF